MIKFLISIPNWLSNSNDDSFLSYFSLDKSLTEHKNLSIDINRMSSKYLFEFEVDLFWWGQDHAGPSIRFNLLGYTASMLCYNRRHLR